MAFMEKEANALLVIKEALARGAGRTAVSFGGGKDSVALLHLVSRSVTGPSDIHVLTIDPPSHPGLYLFMDKAVRLLGAASLWERVMAPAVFHGACDNMFFGASLLASAAAAEGYTRLLTGARKDEDGAAPGLSVSNGCAGIEVINPLLDFTEDEVFEYIRMHRLPSCSLYRKGVRKIGCIPGRPVFNALYAHDDSGEEEMLRSRLKGLGYL